MLYITTSILTCDTILYVPEADIVFLHTFVLDLYMHI